MHQMRVAVLRGGPSNEYDVSIKTGAAILRALEGRHYRPIDVFIDRAGVWHVRGLPREPHHALEHADVVVNALHGTYGEDGEVQKLLDGLNVPYTGSGVVPSRLAMHKAAAKKRLEPHGIKVARHAVLSVVPDMEAQLLELFRTFPQPVIVKPAASGSSVGVSLAHGFDELKRAVQTAFEHSTEVLIEEYIRGREATVGVIDQFRNAECYALLPVEIVPPEERTFFDYDAKYTGISQELCPGRFSRAESEELQRLAQLAHRGLGLRHYSRSDFIISKNGIYYLETNTLPGLTEESLVPRALSAVGATLPEFLDHIIGLAVNKK